jgi:hypothetical protein
MSDAFRMVPVPNRHVPAVYRLLADLESAPSLAAPEAASDSGEFEWNEGNLSEIASGRFTTTQAVGAVMDFLSDHPDEWFDQNELAAGTGRTKSQLIVVWSKFGPHLEKHYGTTVWPLKIKNGRYLNPPRSASMHYSMTPELSALWQSVREEG